MAQSSAVHWVALSVALSAAAWAVWSPEASIGAATGAIIANEAERRNGGYYWWHGGCYYRYPNGASVQVGFNYCGY